MDETNAEIKPRDWTRGMKKVADRGETIVRIPPVVEPVEVEVALAIVAPEIRDVAVAVRVLPGRANVQDIVYTTIP